MAVKLFGDDMEVRNSTANQIAAVLQTISGATEVKLSRPLAAHAHDQH